MNLSNSSEEDIPLARLLVGPSFQCKIPDLCSEYVREFQDNDELLWKPEDNLNDENLNKYLTNLKKNGPLFNTEDALFNLLKNNYNTEKAIDQLKTNTELQSKVNQTPKPFTAAEYSAFEEGLKKFEKNFSKIQKKKLPKRSVNDLVHFYYHWKHTAKYNEFIENNTFKKSSFLYRKNS